MRVVRAARLLLIGALSMSLLATGCASSTNRDSSAALADQKSASVPEEKARYASVDERSAQDPYFNSSDSGDEDAPTNPVLRVFSAAGTGVANFFSAIVDIPVSGAKWLSGDRPGNAARMMEDSASADNRRQGINKLLEYDFTKRDPYTRRYRQIAQFDTDPTVRATAIRAGNRARDASATSIFVKGLDDQSEWVRLEAAKALTNVPDSAAVPALLRTLNNADENRDVRVASADALKHYRTLTVARALVAVLNERDFAISWQARRSLKYLFSRDLGYSDSAWLAYLSGPQSPLK